MEDLDALEYTLLTVYSGKDYWKNKGVDIAYQIRSVKSMLSDKTIINKIDFFYLICNALDGIKDYHLVFTLPYFNKNYGFCRHNTLYFADIVMQKYKGSFVVCESKYDEIVIGSVILPKEKSAFLTFNNKYLYGTFSEMPINAIDITVNDKKVKVPVYDKNYPVAYQSESLWYKGKIGKTDIVRINRLTAFNKNEEKEMQELIEYGKELRNSKRLIIDLRGNSGGWFEYARQFIENFNTVAVSNAYYAKLNTQASRLSEISMYAKDDMDYENRKSSILKDPSASWNYSGNQKRSNGTFKGELYILTDRLTGSSAELTIKCLKDNIPQCKLVGENTKGCLNTGDIRYFYLPNSLIFLNIPTAIFA